MTIDFSVVRLTRQDSELHSEHEMKFESLQNASLRKPIDSVSAVRERGLNLAELNSVPDSNDRHRKESEKRNAYLK